MLDSKSLRSEGGGKEIKEAVNMRQEGNEKDKQRVERTDFCKKADDVE